MNVAAPTRVRVRIRGDDDVLVACQKGRAMAMQLGFSGVDQAILIIAISEVAHNQVDYAGGGEIVLQQIHKGGSSGIRVVARDEGPGIDDVEQALEEGYTMGSGLGLGLSGARRMVDEFDVVSGVGEGTVVTMTQWRKE